MPPAAFNMVPDLVKLTSFHALGPRGQRIWQATRWAVPARQRFFFEGSMDVRGQLWYAERKLLYETVHRTRPQAAFEIGTWEGGGSTFFIVSALVASGQGVLHTVESDPERHAIATRSYQTYLPELVGSVRFHRGWSLEVIPDLLAEEGRCDFLFLDGAQDPSQTLDELAMFRDYFKPGSVLVAHDWDNDKMASVRPEIESDPRFEILQRLTAPVSVGMVTARVVDPGSL